MLTLWHGISVSDVKFPNFKIEQLYIKLDKKLILQAKNIDILIKKTKIAKDNSKDEFSDLIKKIPLIYKYFKTIDVKNLNLQNNHVDVLFHDDIFFVDTKYLELNTKISNENKKLKLLVKTLSLKDFNLTLSGDVIGDIKAKTATFDGRFQTFNIKGDMSLKVDNSMVYYKLSTDDFTTLAPFMKGLGKKVHIEKEANDWIYKKITAKHYKILSLEGKADFVKQNFYLNDIKGVAKGSDVNIKFHKNVPPATIQNLDIKLKNNRLYFDMQSGMYQGLKLQKSNAYIYNLLTHGNGIVLNLFAKAPLNKDVQKILKAYRINVPVTQTKGDINASLKMDIRFVPYDIDVKGEFDINPSEILIARAPFSIGGGKITLDNRLLRFYKTNMRYRSLFDITTSGLMDLYKYNYDGNTTINRLHVVTGNLDMLDLKRYKLNTKIVFKKGGLEISLPKLNSDISFISKKNTISQNDLSMLYKNSSFMKKYNIYNGKVKIHTKDFENFMIDTNITSMKPILSKNGKSVDKLNLKATTSGEDVKVYSKSNILFINADKKAVNIDIKNADILIDTNKSASESSSDTNINISGKNANLIITDLNRTLLSDSFNASLKNGAQSMHGKYKDGNYSFSKTPDRIVVEAFNMNSTFANSLFNKNLFKEGTFSAKILGADLRAYTGVVNIKNSFVKTFAVYNNLLAFINSIPSLIAFRQPGFSEKGYSIKEANAIVTRKEDKLTIHSIDVKGIDADIVGKGSIDLATGKINMDIKLQTFKVLSDVIKHIPIVNYILLGKDKSIATAIHVGGTLDKPKITTQTLQDMAIVPFDIVKRTLTFPFNLGD